MEKLREAVYQGLRDDATASIGIRALLGHAATPWGVYFHHFPEAPDFSSVSYLTYYLLAIQNDQAVIDVGTRLRQAVIVVTAWSEDPVVVDRVLRRVANVLEGQRKVTLPTTQCELHRIDAEGEGPDLFDDEFKVHYRAGNFRCWYRDDVTT